MTGYAQYIAPDGKAITTGGAPTLGVEFDPNPQISALHIAQGKPPTTPNDVVMDLGTAQKYDFKVGQKVRILLQGPTRTFTITGLMRFGTANNLAGATLAAFDIPTAQALLGEVGPVRQHQRRRRTRRRTRRPSNAPSPASCPTASRW